MKIYLFYQDKIYNFMLPKEISGSYSFDANKNETSKLVNIEARDGKWVIYSIDGVNLIYDRRYTKELPLQDGSFYVVHRDDKNYLVYACSVEASKFYPYTFSKGFSMTISNSGSVNVLYSCPYLNSTIIKLYIHENTVYLEQSKVNMCYVNKKLVIDNQHVIKNGDMINVFGLEIIYLNHLIFINNPHDSVKINNFDFGLLPYKDNDEEIDKNVVIQDKDLYDKKDYFSKSPRIRRIIETKKLKLSPPPGSNEGEELPFILTVGPMATMGVMSLVMVINVVMRLRSGETTLDKSWPQLATSGAMLLSMLMWPMIIRWYNKKTKARKKKELIEKYDAYLAEKEKEVVAETHLQKDILIENLISLDACLDIINQKTIGFWDKRVDQNDFLVARLGMGSQLLDMEIEYPDQEFTIEEDELRKRADAMVERYKYIPNVPVSYSFYDNRITAIMSSDRNRSLTFMNNILLQLLTFYSYEDLKLVIFTNEDKKNGWEYVKFLNHSFDNERKFRFFASDIDSVKAVSEYLNGILNSRKGSKDDDPQKPHYLVIVDDYDLVKRFDFMKNLTELDDEENAGFSLVLLEDKLNKLPSKCNNFISLSSTSSILKNSYDKQEQIPFKDEINYNIDMMRVAKIMSNIPIEFEEGVSQLPDAISFLEMHNVGKVEQLNVLNRWSTSDSTMTLRAEIGLDNQGDIMYLDLHEKVHGPHGLIAGTTGSGKSEFIITYILSMCINYSPDDISFILIDYKGGGLALAFENRTAGIVLPHLAGTITNLDKAEMDRTLVSIESEAKRRQELFNKARDTLGESTMDIYKYQRLYKEGKLTEAVPHLFIICDEFAELKQQQPDFMDNLISIARIGRSLGVHLILATQKPSGVVNDQIWSNSRFKVCLKVQDEADSKEMIKRPDAAYIRNAGRYYLMVGYDEYFAQGQSGYTGAKYFPSDRIVKQVDKSINFINDFGQPIKSIQASAGSKAVAQGDQIKAVMDLIINLAKEAGKQARQLWLPNIPETILVDELTTKYNINHEKYHPIAVLGEYDAPEKQEQGKVVYDLLEDGNAALYGSDGSEREMFLSALIYDLAKNYTAEEVNIYTIDYGSEALRRFQPLPQVGGMVFPGDDEKYNNLLKMLRDEMSERKKLFVDYGGEYTSYIKNSPKKLPLIVTIVNNYDSINESVPTAYEEYPDLVRDSERYGIVYVFTGNGISSIHRRVSQNLPTIYALKLKDQYDYAAVLNAKTKLTPRDILGRGAINNDGVHEFQTAKIIADDDKMNDFLQEFISKQKEINNTKAKRIPVLPDIVRYSDIENDISDLSNIPIGIYKNDLEIAFLNLQNSLGTVISSNRLPNTLNFSKSLLFVLKEIKGINLLIVDPRKELELNADEFKNYYTDNLDLVTDKMIEFIKKIIDAKSDQKVVIFIYNVSKYLAKLEDSKKLNDLFNAVKGLENISIIIVDDAIKLKALQFEEWFKLAFSSTDGVWIGKGVSEQSLFRLSVVNKEMMKELKNDMGYVVSESRALLCKYIDFISEDEGDKNGE